MPRSSFYNTDETRSENEYYWMNPMKDVAELQEAIIIIIHNLAIRISIPYQLLTISQICQPSYSCPSCFIGGRGSTFHMLSAYSLMQRSLVKNPMRDTLVIHFVNHSSWFAYAASTRSCVWI